MNERLSEIQKLIAECSAEEQHALKQHLSAIVPHKLETDWQVDAETILSAIERSAPLTKRGVRGVIAEAVFVRSILPLVAEQGWIPGCVPDGSAYDAQLVKGQMTARIQVKLQRSQNLKPKLYSSKHQNKGLLYVVEVQRTRGGRRTTQQHPQETDSTLDATDSVTVQTRPYRFSEFDILAVNMHPSSENWKEFRYTVASWLLSRIVMGETVIETFQPVAALPNDVWTDDLATCLEWLESRKKRSLLKDLLRKE